MTRPDPRNVAGRFLEAIASSHRLKTAGEVRFIKDRTGDKSEWGWSQPGPSEREIDDKFVFDANHLKPLALALRSALMALGHVTSAHQRFVKIKSRNISPDGSLGGKGYIQKIPEMRRQLMNCVEALSSFTDTVYDEFQAPHWDEDKMDSREREEVLHIVEDAEEIKADPEGWAGEEEEEMDDSNAEEALPDQLGRKANRKTAAATAKVLRVRIADRFLNSRSTS